MENASIINAASVPNWEINNSGRLPYLSLKFPNNGPKNKPNIAFVAKAKPVIKAISGESGSESKIGVNSGIGICNCFMKKGRNGINNEKPKISMNIAIQSGKSWGYFIFTNLRSNGWIKSVLVDMTNTKIG